MPALTGLGAPYWDADARGLISGSRAAPAAPHMVRAALEAIAFQTADVVAAMPGCRSRVLRADGGAAANGLLMQFQADMLGMPVEVAGEQRDDGARRGRAGGPGGRRVEREPRRGRRGVAARAPGTSRQMGRDEAAERLAGWHAAVERARARLG